MVACLLSFGGLATSASAQYFGQNKVQYRGFKYEVLQTEHFDVYFYAEERAAVEQAARMAERWYARYSRIFTHTLIDRQPLILYADAPDFQQTNVIQGDLGEGTGGVTEILKRRIVLPMGASLAETDHVIGHELVHAYQFDITSPGTQNSVPGALRLPLWFVEGMAEYLSIGPVDPNTAMWMRDAVRQDKLPTIKDLNNTAKYFPYRWGHAFWAYVGGRWGDRAVSDLLVAGGVLGDLNGVFVKLLGVTPEQLSKDWQASLKAAYQPLQKETKSATDYGRLVVSGKRLGHDYNIAPVISPDGRKMVFLSSRSLFAIDLYLADVATGRIERQLVKTASNPHFASLEFIASAGSWSPDGRRFVFSAVVGGEPELVIMDMTRTSVEREVPFPTLGEIFTPAWSPDSRAVAFSASSGGQNDLYIYDLASGTLDRLTDDLFTDLQPAWSPDGSQLVFVTDRFSTSMADLKTGDYRLGAIDARTHAVRPLPGFPTGKHINPQWSTDGQSVYFLSDRNGISNLYRLDVANGAIGQVTNLLTGVSGITSLSPALSVAAKTGAMAFSVFEEGKYQIYATTQAAPAAVEPVAAPTAAQTAVLPPSNRPDTEIVARELANPNRGLPAKPPERPSPYKPRLSLDYVGQPYLAAGVDPYGTFAGGGVSFFWSDMLGDHSLATALQISSGFGGGISSLWRNSGGLLAYQDLTHRWNWGVAVQQVPFLTGGFQTVTAGTDGHTAVQTTTLLQQTDRSVSAVTAYPFNRAQRIEFSAGFSNIGFSEQIQTTTVSLDTGQVLGDEATDRTTGRSLNLGQASAALVHDTTIYGATSPIAGQRYRIEYAPTFGSISLQNVLADYRRYVMPVDFYTLAGRVLHFGRWGPNANDARLWPLYLGYPNLVRGYDFNSFSVAECGPNPNGSCAPFDNLLGNRILVANLEFRFPLLRPFGLRQGMYGPVPIEVAIFGDAGVAWYQGEKPSFAGGSRKPVSSAGVAFRVNALGIAILEFDVVRPFNRPGQGWSFQFNISPGF